MFYYTPFSVSFSLALPAGIGSAKNFLRLILSYLVRFYAFVASLSVVNIIKAYSRTTVCFVLFWEIKNI